MARKGFELTTPGDHSNGEFDLQSFNYGRLEEYQEQSLRNQLSLAAGKEQGLDVKGRLALTLIARERVHAYRSFSDATAEMFAILDSAQGEDHRNIMRQYLQLDLPEFANQMRAVSGALAFQLGKVAAEPFETPTPPPPLAPARELRRVTLGDWFRGKQIED